MAESVDINEHYLAPSAEYVPRSMARLAWESVTGRYPVHGEVSEADSVVGFAFSAETDERGQHTPGKNNQELAVFIDMHFDHLPKILENGLADAYISMFGDKNVTAIHMEDVPEEYRQGTGIPFIRKEEEFDSRKFALTARDEMHESGLTKPIIVAHPYQMARADAIMQKLGFNTVAPDGLGMHGNFYPDVLQFWTSRWWVWSGYSLATVVHHRATGLI